MIGMLLMLGLVMAALVVLPLLLLKVAFTLLFLPFRILGGLLRAVVGLIAGVASVAAAGFGLLFVVGGIVLGVVLLPLLPFLFVGLILYALMGASRRPATVRVVS